MVGDTGYTLARRRIPGRDGAWQVVRQWVTVDLAGTDESERYRRAGARASTAVGNPLGLVECIASEALVVRVPPAARRHPARGGPGAREPRP